MSPLIQDARYTIKQRRERPGFAAVAILTLALGTGAATMIFIGSVNTRFDGFAGQDASHPPRYISLSDLDVVRNQNHAFKVMVGYSSGKIIVVLDGVQAYYHHYGRLPSDGLESCGVSPLLGRGIAHEGGRRDAAPLFLGKDYTMNGELRALVGIMQPRFQVYGSQPQIWGPITRAHDSPPLHGSSDLSTRQFFGEQQQLVRIARSVIHNPALLLADKLTGNRHSIRAKEIMEFFLELTQGRTTIVRINHSETNAGCGTRTIQLRDGWPVGETATPNLKTDSLDLAVNR
jgi:hypothetical protein